MLSNETKDCSVREQGKQQGNNRFTGHRKHMQSFYHLSRPLFPEWVKESVMLFSLPKAPTKN